MFTLTALCLFSVNGFAQTATDKSTSTNIVINRKGAIYTSSGTPLGYISKDQIVRNNKGEKLYFIDDKGNVIDAKGNKLGMAKKNGDYYNNNGQVILQVKDKDAETCEILDPQGHNMGTVHKNYKLHACAAHCFFLQQKKDKEKSATKM